MYCDNNNNNNNNNDDDDDNSLSYPIPTAICVSASSLLPEPEAIIIAESGTAPNNGRTIPPDE